MTQGKIDFLCLREKEKSVSPQLYDGVVVVVVAGGGVEDGVLNAGHVGLDLLQSPP